jgi:hypothetical protein
MKLSAKFARQENEETRRARITRRRIPRDRADAIRRMLSIPEASAGSPRTRAKAAARGALVCPDCQRVFALPMHLGRHRKRKHGVAAA